MNIRQIRLIPIFLAAVLIFLQYHLWFDSSGILALYDLKKEVTLQMETNRQLKQTNEALIGEINHLHTDRDAIESHARHDLGMVKKDETFYQVIEK